MPEIHDKKGNRAEIDNSTASLQIIEYMHHEIHSGSAYRAGFQKDIANGGTAIFVITTPDTDKEIHFRPAVDVEVECKVELYENPASVTGGTPEYDYSWSNGMTKNNLKKLPKGIYKLKVTDENNCIVYDTVEIIGPDKALFIDFEKKDIVCTGSNTGEIKLFIEGGTPDYLAKWSHKKTGTEFKNLKAGKYSVVVTDKHNCKLKKDIIIAEAKEALLIKIEKINIDCYNEKSGSIYITAQGGNPGYTYEWANGEHAQNLIGLGAGKYTVTVTDNNFCKRVKIIELEQMSELKLKADITPTESDKQTGTISINITGGAKPYSILWDEGQTMEKIINLRKGIHEVIITDTKDCQLVKSFEIGEK